MVQETEGNFKVGDKSLYTKSWLPADSPKAKLIFVHGFSDHVNAYYGFFPYLAERGIAVYAFDQRGWGRSVSTDAERGLTGPTSQVIADIAAFLEPHLPSRPEEGPPVFVMGHSMGGGEVLTLACDPAYGERITSRVRGWMLEAPFIAFAPEDTPSFLKVFFGRLAGRFLPHMHLKNQIPPETLTRDPEVVKAMYADELMHDTGTLEGLASLLDRTAELSEGRTKALPQINALWLGHGTEDKGTSYEGSKKWFDDCTGAVKDKTFKTYEGAYHQLHTDTDREVFYADVAKWILDRVDTKSPEAKL